MTDRRARTSPQNGAMGGRPRKPSARIRAMASSMLYNLGVIARQYEDGDRDHLLAALGGFLVQLREEPPLVQELEALAHELNPER